MYINATAIKGIEAMNLNYRKWGTWEQLEGGNGMGKINVIIF